MGFFNNIYLQNTIKSFLLYQKRKERETMKIDKTVIIDEIETAKSQIIDILSEDQEREESTAERIINIGAIKVILFIIISAISKRVCPLKALIRPASMPRETAVPASRVKFKSILFSFFIYINPFQDIQILN